MRLRCRHLYKNCQGGINTLKDDTGALHKCLDYHCELFLVSKYSIWGNLNDNNQICNQPGMNANAGSNKDTGPSGQYSH